ncbi:MAG TPA: S26 family signal peptidase, partial [Planctomycetaceae bacterium]|nr:S26 family signal peptidase [Planctomycetaceae bacterium]
MLNPVIKAREPWLAITLSLLCGGLGQIYCGAVRRGLLINGGCLLLGLAIVGLAAVANSTPAVAVFAVVALGLVWLALWSVRDAGRLARLPEMREYALQEYNDPWVYTILILPTVPLAIALAMFLRSNVVEAFVIPSDSMAPTIVAGDRILTNKLGVATRTLERG